MKCEKNSKSEVGPKKNWPSYVQRGKAPPIEPFTGEGSNVHWDDWLPTLEQAAMWNRWDDQEKLIQLAGHLHGKAQREWN